MAEEKNNNKTFILIIAVCSFLVIGLVSILKERETEHLSYSENSTVEREAELYKNVKDYDNVMVPSSGTTIAAPAKKVPPKQHTMQNTKPYTNQSKAEAGKHTMQNTKPFANQSKADAEKHTMRNN